MVSSLPLDSVGMQIFPCIALVSIGLKEGIMCWFSTAHGNDTLSNRTGLDS